MDATDTIARFPERLGLGTWEYGNHASHRATEVAAVVYALQAGYRMIDTAEMYARGGAERIVGEGLRVHGRAHRDRLFIVSKVLPDHASRRGCAQACEASIERMGCDYLDLYLLHWPGSHPYSETLQGFRDLMQRGLIRNFGVSNLDLSQMKKWREAEEQLGVRSTLQCNQIYYSVMERGAEFDLVPWQRQQGIQTMAYSPLGRGPLASHPRLHKIAQARGATAAQVALAWCIRAPDFVAIPKSVHPERLSENLKATELVLTVAELAAIDAEFPPPTRLRPLAST